MANDRALRGKASHVKGHAAEEQVASYYQNAGATLLEKRWRGGSGEIDLIFEIQSLVVFVEVKSSRSRDRAATHLSAAQAARLQNAALAYVATRPSGLLTDMRFDVALVFGAGEIEILENAIGQG